MEGRERVGGILCVEVEVRIFAKDGSSGWRQLAREVGREGGKEARR